MVYNVLTPRHATHGHDWLGCQDGTQATPHEHALEGTSSMSQILGGERASLGRPSLRKRSGDQAGCRR